MRVRRLLPALLAFGSVGLLSAQTAAAPRVDPVQWSLTLEPATAAPGATVLARLRATVQPGYHVYSLTPVPDGPIATTAVLAPSPIVASTELYQPVVERKFDPNFNKQIELFDGEFTLVFRVGIAADAPGGAHELTAQVRYQACSDKECLRPVRKTAVATVNINPAVRAAAPAIPPGYSRASTPPTPPVSGVAASAGAPAPMPTSGPADEGLARFLAVAFGFGLAAIFTPCVFPMIPIVFSTFLNRGAQTTRQKVYQAGLFCLGIIALFTVLGMAITAIAGPFGVVQLGANPWVNAFIATLFVAFGLSLLGAFELTLPSGLLTRLNQASEGSGIGPTLLMGLAFSLTSFACVGPFVGTLLAASVQASGWQPVLGMLAFATGLASPFFFLALFPSLLQRMPRSGGWLARVKVVMGFVILAAALKYWSNVDLVLHGGVLSRERFLAVWMVLFLLPGLYLLGLLRLEGIKPEEPVGIGRLLSGSAFLVFAISLLPGLFGASLGEVEPYVPAPAATTLAASSGPEAAPAWMKNQYRDALAKARQDNQLLLVSFTGYACTNCKWMKANMFPRPAVREAMKDRVLVELYTDGTSAVDEENQKLQESRFASVAIPYYALVDGNERVVATFAGSTRDEAAFVRFLRGQSAT